jgi:membrane fusion protein (multidrug efflux system)
MQLNTKQLKPFKFQAALALLASCILLVAGCEKKNTQSARQAPTPVVSVVTVQPQAVTLTVELPGRTSAYRIAEIRPQVNGLIQKRLFTEGTVVNAGDILYQIDPAPFEAALQNAKAALIRSKASLPAVQSRAGRYKELLAEKAVSQQDYDDALSALQQAEADIKYWQAILETAQINLAYTKITAPISGRIGISNVTEGAIATAYQPVALATIQQLDPIYVDVTQSTTQQMRIKQLFADGQLNPDGKNQKKVEVIMADNSEYPDEGTLQFSDITVDPSTGSVLLRVVVPNPDGSLLPGMYVRARMVEGINNQAILVPQQGVSRDPKGNPLALVIESEDTVGQRMLTIDRAIGDKWLVSSGLTAGDKVIVEGLQNVRPGMSVNVTPFETETSDDMIKSDAQNPHPDKTADGGK